MTEEVIMLDESVREWIGLLAYRLAGKTDALFPLLDVGSWRRVFEGPARAWSEVSTGVLPRPHHMLRPAHRMRWVCCDDAAGHQPVTGMGIGGTGRWPV
jgi:hypothetical protein